MKRTQNWCMVLAIGIAAVLAGCGANKPEGGISEENNIPVQGSSYRDDVAVKDLQEAVAEEMGDAYWPDMDVPADMFGITEDMYDEIVAQVPMNSANVDTLVIVKAKEGSEQQVEDALEAYKEYNTTEAQQYPANIGKVQAAQVERYGRYICFVQLGAEVPEDDEGDSEDGDAAAITHCEQENARALVVIEDMLIK